MSFSFDEFDDENILRNSCPKCDTEYNGTYCPNCGLKFRPRCPDCGSRMAWSENLQPCMNCGFPPADKIFFVEITEKK